MATVPNPRTWAVGELLTAAKLNTDLRDGLNFLLSPPLCTLKTTLNTTMNAVTHTPIPFNSEVFDRDGGHDNSTNNTRYTVQTAGFYRITGTLGMNGTGAGQVYLKKNGSTIHTGTSVDSASVGDRRYPMTAVLSLAVSDYIEMIGFSTPATTVIGSDTFMELQWISKP